MVLKGANILGPYVLHESRGFCKILLLVSNEKLKNKKKCSNATVTLL
jgi:hypothetical protein